ncbi:MAG: DNA topoisomerase III [Deltaproteobacteria bacterium]|nr:MAG: DNA topoisomerase III [Deltaproteobacteria bacterium]
MGKRLVIAEKPSVARDIVAALGGFDEKGEYFESDDFIVTWALGHLLELAEPKAYNTAWRSWSIKNLPMIPDEFQLEPKTGQKTRLDMIKKLGRRKDVDGSINACDAGREGEMIFRRIAEYANLDKKPSQRLWLQSMTQNAILQGFEHLRPGADLDSLGDAAWLRAVGDWLIGMNATRALTQRLKSRGEKTSWSAGRVQTPTLALLVNREHEILAHVPRPFVEITANFKHEDQEWLGRFFDESLKNPEDRDARSTRLFDLERAGRIATELEKVVADGKPPGEARETRKKRNEKPPLPFDLTTLQREANRRFSFSAKRTLDAAQRLYEGHKVLTYPRTDSRHLPDDYGPTIDEILGNLAGLVDYQSICGTIDNDGAQNLDKVLDSTKVSDHFAIVPTGTLPEQELSGDDARIYDLVVRQFLASLMSPAVWAVVERFVDVVLPSETVTFRTTAKSLEVPGFFEALGRESQDSDLPALVPGSDNAEGVRSDVLSYERHDKDTNPPPRLTEAQLLRMMETAGEALDDDELSEAMKGRGLGTPATRADTIEGLVRKGYARRVEGKVGPTSKAMRLFDVIRRLDVPTIASPALTGEWEHALQQVQDGELTRKELLDRLVAYTREITDAFTGFDHATLFGDLPSVGTCPQCGGQVGESAWGYSCENNVQGDDTCSMIIWKDRAGRYIDRATAGTLLRDGKAGPLTGFVDRYGRSLEGMLYLEKDEEKGRWGLRTEFGDPPEQEAEEVVGPLYACPMHEDCQIIETNLRYVCKKLLDGEIKKGPLVPKVVCHREMQPDELEPFFGEAGKTEIFPDFISKRGRAFKGALVRRETGRYGFEFPPREPRAKATAGARTTAMKKKAEGTATTAKKKATTTRKKKTTTTTRKKKAPAAEAPATET